MVGVISQLALHQGKKQEFVKQRARLALDNDRNRVEEQTNTACSQVHAIPGRIRLQVPRSEDSEYLERQEVVHTDVLVKSDRINSIAASIVIQSEQNEISDEQMRSHLLSLINSKADAALAVLPTKISSLPECANESILTCSLEIRASDSRFRLKVGH